jgi:hypothetical protein
MTPSEEHIAFYMAIGMAITQWSFVEHGLYLIARRAFGSDEQTDATLASGFFSIENFRSKLAFVDRAFAASPFADQFGQEWGGIREAVRGLSSRRNELAHSRVMIYPAMKGGRRYAIIPMFPKSSPKKATANSPPPGSLCVRDIDLIGSRFGRATTQLWSFHLRIGGEEDLFAEPAQREPIAKTVDQLRNQIHSMLGTRET